MKLIYRTETHRIKRSNKAIYKLLNDLTFKAKNLYNLTLYTQRQIFFREKTFLNYQTTITLLQDTKVFKDLPCALSQYLVKQITETCKSFQQASKTYSITPEKFIADTRTPINADINASYQITKKAFPDLTVDFSQFTKEQLHNKLQPIIKQVA